jgi:hypothetical protein
VSNLGGTAFVTLAALALIAGHAAAQLPMEPPSPGSAILWCTALVAVVARVAWVEPRA